MATKWVARIVSDGEPLDTATGATAEDAILSLVTDITNLWRDGDYVLDSGFFQEIADVLAMIEVTQGEQEKYVMHCGDMIDPWYIEVVREETPDTDMGELLPICECGGQLRGHDHMGRGVDICTECGAHVWQDDCQLINDETDF